ncbi:MAG: FMN-binding protein [Candidatus Omnitrophica bacterium]|nr:FMN-binding protein [Candidatus Omnitrophota bacterium]
MKFLLFFILGFFSLVSQTLVIREFIISFGGNELGISLFYFFWLFWVGIGALLATTFLSKFFIKNFFKLLLLYPQAAYFQIFLFINLKTLAGVSRWEFFSFEKVFIFLFIFTSFISLFTGIIFTTAIYFFKKKEDITSVVSFAYIYESLGSFLAGCIVTILIVKLIPAQTILLVFSLFFYFVFGFLSIRFKERLVFFINIILFSLFFILFINQEKVIQFSQNLRLKNLIANAKLVKEVYSPYQHLILAKQDKQVLVISNGEIISSIPEVIDADKEAALFMAETNLAKEILIFGYGAENLINSLLKFPINKITYCVEDKAYFKLLKENLKKDNRLEVSFMPPQEFLEKKNKFDFVIVYTLDPTNIILNNFFTKEFYQLVKSNLNQRGVFATRITSAENFLGTEIKNYGSSVYYTLSEVFKKIVIVPEKINWFFASDLESNITDDVKILEERFSKIKPIDSTFFKEGFKSIFLEDRVNFIRNLYMNNPLFKDRSFLNTRSKPLTFFLNILVLAKYSNSYLVKFLKGVFLTGQIFFVIFLVILFIFRILFLLRIENISTKRIIFNAKLFQFISGFLGFSYHISLIYLFQSIFGTIFQLIGLVNAIFMFGLCLGGFFSKILLKKFKAAHITFSVLFIEGIVFIISYFIFSYLKIIGVVKFILFIFLFLISGLLTGSSYPLVSKLLDEQKIPTLLNAANLEFLDHFGGSIAGLLTGLFMLPILGIFNTFVILFFISIFVASLFFLEIFSFFKERQAIKFLSFPYIRTSYTLFALASAFLLNSYFIDAKRNLFKEEISDFLVIKGCSIQNQPFFAYICETNGRKEYILETDKYVTNIKGFTGPIKLEIALTENGNITRIKVLEHKETPHYVRDLDKFLKQFEGRFIEEEFSTQNIDTMTGATITSTAIIDIVNEVGRKIKDKLTEQKSTSSISTQNVIFDKNCFYLFIFTFFAIILYCFFKNVWLRKIFLFFVVIFLGFISNLTFSFNHLANLLTFNFLSSKFLSQIFIYILPIFLGILFGQFWCSWLCPFGALQEILGSTKTLRKISGNLDNKARYFKYVFLTIFVIFLSVRRDVFIFRQEPLSVFFLKRSIFWIDKTLAFVSLFFSIFFFRFWCRYFCVCGAFFAFFNKIAILKRFFIKKYKNCDFGVNSQFDLDCLNCNYCLKKTDGK